MSVCRAYRSACCAWKSGDCEGERYGRDIREFVGNATGFPALASCAPWRASFALLILSIQFACFGDGLLPKAARSSCSSWPCSTSRSRLRPPASLSPGGCTSKDGARPGRRWGEYAFRPMPLRSGRSHALARPGRRCSDYLLFVDARAVGVVEAKKEGAALISCERPVRVARPANGTDGERPAAWRRCSPGGTRERGVKSTAPSSAHRRERGRSDLRRCRCQRRGCGRRRRDRPAAVPDARRDDRAFSETVPSAEAGRARPDHRPHHET